MLSTLFLTFLTFGSKVYGFPPKKGENMRVGRPYRVQYDPETGRLRLVFFYPSEGYNKEIFPDEVKAILFLGRMWGIAQYRGCCRGYSKHPGKLCLVFSTAKGVGKTEEMSGQADQTLKVIYGRPRKRGWQR